MFWFIAALLACNGWSRFVLDDASLSATLRATLLLMVAFSIEGVRPLGRFADAFLTVQSPVDSRTVPVADADTGDSRADGTTVKVFRETSLARCSRANNRL